MKEGNILKSLLDRMEYVVKSLVNSMVVLQSRKGDRIILTGAETLKKIILSAKGRKCMFK